MKKWFTDNFPNYEDKTHPNQINTEHIIKEHGDALKKVEAISVADIFKPEKSQPIRTVLTIGEACIGKTFRAQKFTRDWATSRTTFFTRLWNFATQKQPDENILFHLTLHQLSDLMEEKLSLVELLNHFFKDTQDCVVSDFEKYALVIVLDGLDQHLLNFNHDVKTLSDVREVAPVNMLLTNLIMGNLLPSAHLWILSRPLAAQQIPPEYVHRQTEIREKPDFVSQRKLKACLIKQCQRVSEGTSQQGKSALLHDIYTDVHIIEGESEDAIGQNKSTASCESVTQDTPIKHDLFKFGQKGEIRNVLTNGIAGIGKTIVLQKNMLDWAEGVINQDIYFVFTFPFRHLNLMAAKDYSFEELINCFFPEMKTSEIANYDKYKILIVLDGLDECRLDLNFIECKDWSDTKKPAPLNVLLTNLIKGNLLPGAQLWITARPASSRNIPSQYINLVTEVCGFTDDQKKQYFKKRFQSQNLAERILSHIKKSRALYVMCCIPVFCWITSTVLEDFLCSEQEVPTPKTLTDMYIGFLLLQCKLNINKYQGVDETKGDIQVMDLYWTEKNKETVLSLGKLAYEELERDNLVFREEDLKQRAMDVTECAVYSGLFTQISQECYDLLKQNLYSFVHLSIQEFLAAVYAFVTFVNTGVNVLTKPASTVRDQPASDFYTCAVDKALENPNGHWDMFLRFLLGISQETNQKPLQALLVSQSGGNQPETNKDTIKYIKNKIKEDIDANKSINLFHCLNELNDHSLVKDIQHDLKKKKHDFKKFTRSQWSALTFVLLTSDADLDVFDLNNYFKSEEVLLGMLPVVKVSRTALLSWSDLTAKSCASLASSILTSSSSNLTVLDLSHNDIKDTGVEKLAEGLKSKCCRLEILKLIGCQVTNTGCLSLASALEFNPLCLQELDLSYNHPGESGEQKLSAIGSLKKLRMDHGGECRLKPDGVELTLDVNTASKKLLLSDAGRTARRREVNDNEAHYPEHDDRFLRTQVLCEEELTGFCYWEVEWHGHVGVAVVDGQINRKGWDCLSGFGTNNKSWNLVVSINKNTLRYKAWSGSKTMTPQCHELGLSTTHPKLGVFLDRDGGTLNFYDVSSEKPRHIHTFKDLKGFKLYAGFWFKKGHLIPQFFFICLGMGGASLYLLRLARGPHVTWNKTNNPEPWNKLDPSYQYKSKRLTREDENNQSLWSVKPGMGKGLANVSTRWRRSEMRATVSESSSKKDLKLARRRPPGVRALRSPGQVFLLAVMDTSSSTLSARAPSMPRGRRVKPRFSRASAMALQFSSTWAMYCLNIGLVACREHR
ncbi:NLR family CARD domain-containing protein 3 [Merluccius polli]|uniref:NLR family CARD domain-containing protein 3 n=1 Tax=Merluccius polli TaxID=89951 RepID=A0AA47N3I7_MERPO|nr:NLR family CARD domain-containing protein 3 [Merluccius polli]